MRARTLLHSLRFFVFVEPIFDALEAGFTGRLEGTQGAGGVDILTSAPARVCHRGWSEQCGQKNSKFIRARESGWDEGRSKVKIEDTPNLTVCDSPRTLMHVLVTRREDDRTGASHRCPR